MGEWDFIDWLRRHIAADPRVLVGPGDDCAVLGPTAAPLLATTDMLLEGVHFELAKTSPALVGRKALAVNLSDIAAMAGKPLAALVSVGLPAGGPPSLAQEVFQGIRDLALAFDTAIIGGDTNASPAGLVVSITLLGEAQPPGPVLRSGAQPGDWILVTGPLGGSILGKHLDFTPRVAEARALHQLAALHAMIDVSDGLAVDLHHICAESGCGASIFADSVPVAAAAHQLNDGTSPLLHALGDGEDFELLFTLAAADARRLVQTQPVPGITLVHVGICQREPGLFLAHAGTTTPLEPRGFQHHFGKGGEGEQ